jgi:hypothetical protein
MRYQQYITNALMASALFVIDLFSRYLLALAVGIAYAIYSGLVGLGTAMSHFGMLGKMMDGDLFMSMLVEVPVWMVLAKILSRYWRPAYAEVASAALVAIVVGVLWAQVVRPIPELVEGSITIDAKKDVLLWHILAMTNLILGVACAISYLAAKRLFGGVPRPGWLGYKPWK